MVSILKKILLLLLWTLIYALTLVVLVDGNSKSYLWLTNTLLPQFIKWGTESLVSKSKPNVICTESLALISKTKYYEKYNDLKIKYGKEMVQVR